MKLYHGSDISVSVPLAGIGRDRVDFGQGFYLTALRVQAISWAQTIASRHRGAQAILNQYEFDRQAAMADCGIRYKVFASYDKEWLDYVVDCRRGGRLQHRFDVVEGGVANDNVIDTVEDYENGMITATQALGQLAYKKTNQQLCIRSQVVLDLRLQFIRSVVLRNDCSKE